jgi:serine protease Do
LTPTIAGQIGLDASTKGLVVTNVDPSSDAAQSGFTRGVVILSANGQPVTTVAQFEAVVKSAQAAGRTAILLRAQQRGSPAVTLPVRLR